MERDTRTIREIGDALARQKRLANKEPEPENFWKTGKNRNNREPSAHLMKSEARICTWYNFVILQDFSTSAANPGASCNVSE